MLKKIININYKKIIDEPLALVIVLYILSILIISPWFDFPLRDDYYYLTQVKAFSLGIWSKSALIGPTFVLQGIIGFIWSMLFGINYLSLRILTIIVTIIFTIGIDKILTILDIRKSLKTLILAILIFNPIIYSCSITFLTENYFLLFITWSLYNFLVFVKSDNTKNLLIASTLGGLSIMIRQYGVVLPITYILVYLFMRKGKINYKEVAYIIIPSIVFGYLGIFWPKFESTADPKSLDISLFFADFGSILSRLGKFLVAPYLGYFILPITIPILSTLKREIKVLILLLSVPLSLAFYRINIFKIGNLFYLEGINARLVVNIREHLFNNVPFKVFLSFLISISFLLIILFLMKLFKSVLRNKSSLISSNTTGYYNLTLLVALVGFYSIVMITDRVFDRYLVNFFFIFIILVSIAVNSMESVPGKGSLLLLLLSFSITFLLTFDDYKMNETKWKLVDKLGSKAEVERKHIFLDDVYASTIYMDMRSNYEGYYSVKPDKTYNPVCFIQEYTKQSDNLLNNVIKYIQQRGKVRKYLYNSGIPNSGLLKNLVNRFENTDILFFEDEYKSPVHNVLGRRLYVRAFCVEDYREKIENQEYNDSQ